MTDTQDYVLSDLQHGKAEVRLVKVDRDTATHVLHDLTVTTQLRGDFAGAYTDGDNSHVHATDTQKNTVYALARSKGVDTPEGFLLDLADHWAAKDWVTGTLFRAEQASWERWGTGGHSFVRAGRETRTAVVQSYGAERFVLAGVTDLVVLNSTGSEFHGFPRDEHTLLAETDDRILATSVTATWRYRTGVTDLDWDAAYTAVTTAMLDAFASRHSLALQQTIAAMGEAALAACPAIEEIRIVCPNKHHVLVDLAPFGLENPGEVFVAADRPYGLISATLTRAGGDAEPRAWAGVAELP